MQKIKTNWRAMGRSLGRVVCIGTICALPASILAADQADSSMNKTNSMLSSTEPSAAALPEGFQKKDLNDQAQIKEEIVKLTDHGLTKGDYDKLIAELSKPNAQQAKTFKDADQSALDKTIDQIHSQFRSKYGQDFAATKEHMNLDDSKYAIVQGAVTDATLASANWPVAAIMGQPVNAGQTMTPNNSAANNTNSNTISGAQNDANKSDKAEKAELSKGTDVALFTFPSDEKSSPLTISMVKQLMGGWTISVPESRTGDQIYRDYSAELTYLSTHSDQWPSDVGDAYKMMGRCIAASLYGVSEHNANNSGHMQ